MMYAVRTYRNGGGYKTHTAYATRKETAKAVPEKKDKKDEKNA